MRTKAMERGRIVREDTEEQEDVRVSLAAGGRSKRRKKKTKERTKCSHSWVTENNVKNCILHDIESVNEDLTVTEINAK